jgi:hypothetical protein
MWILFVSVATDVVVKECSRRNRICFRLKCDGNAQKSITVNSW